jgi:deazaflavin-dependent oxidoreductase (nitroreductase family)
MNDKDKDTTLIPDNGTSPLAEKLQRIAAYERGRRKTVPGVIRSAGRTRAWAAFYRRYGPKADPWLLRKTQGRAALRIGFPELLLTTTGAKSGLPRVMPLIYVRDGDDFVVVGTNFGQRHHPGWTANLLAHADASIEVGPEQLPVTGELADQATWERLWPRFVAIYPGYADYLTRCGPRKPRMFRLRPRPIELSNRQ